MALFIETICINCDMCVLECPNNAITLGAIIYEIDPDKCTECIGYYDDAQCVLACPIDCIKTDPQHIESPTTLFEKYTTLLS